MTELLDIGGELELELRFAEPSPLVLAVTGLQVDDVSAAHRGIRGHVISVPDAAGAASKIPAFACATQLTSTDRTSSSDG